MNFSLNEASPDFTLSLCQKDVVWQVKTTEIVRSTVPCVVLHCCRWTAHSNDSVTVDKCRSKAWPLPLLKIRMGNGATFHDAKWDTLKYFRAAISTAIISSKAPHHWHGCPPPVLGWPESKQASVCVVDWRKCAATHNTLDDQGSLHLLYGAAMSPYNMCGAKFSPYLGTELWTHLSSYCGHSKHWPPCHNTL